MNKINKFKVHYKQEREVEKHCDKCGSELGYKKITENLTEKLYMLGSYNNLKTFELTYIFIDSLERIENKCVSVHLVNNQYGVDLRVIKEENIILMKEIEEENKNE